MARAAAAGVGWIPAQHCVRPAPVRGTGKAEPVGDGLERHDHCPVVQDEWGRVAAVDHTPCALPRTRDAAGVVQLRAKDCTVAATRGVSNGWRNCLPDAEEQEGAVARPNYLWIMVEPRQHALHHAEGT
jgi:hypothetical protein